MTAPLNSEFAHALFPPAAFININHLGLSTRKRFDSKQRLVRTLVERNTFVNVEAIHVSSARAQDAVFDHFRIS